MTPAGNDQLLRKEDTPEFAGMLIDGLLSPKAEDLAYLAIGAYDVDDAVYEPFLRFTSQQDTPTGEILKTMIMAEGAGLDMAYGNHAIGSSLGANELTLGSSDSIIRIPGNLVIEAGTGSAIELLREQLELGDKLPTLNIDGLTGSGDGAGFEIQEDTVITGYFKTAADRLSYVIKAPGRDGIVALKGPTTVTTVTLTMLDSLSVDAASSINQDVRSAASPEWANVQLANGGALRTKTSDGDILKLQGYDVDGAAYTDFLTITAGDTPTCALAGAVTAVTHASGTDTTQIASCAFVQDAVGAVEESFDEITGATTDELAANGRYTAADNVTKVERSLPTTCARGKVIKFNGSGVAGWKINQAAGQQIVYNTASTTAGVGGYIESQYRYDCISLECIVVDSKFRVFAPSGAPSLM